MGQFQGARLRGQGRCQDEEDEELEEEVEQDEEGTEEESLQAKEEEGEEEVESAADSDFEFPSPSTYATMQSVGQEEPNYRRTYKVDTFLSKLLERWQGAFYPGKEVSVDECMIAFKGRCKFIVYHSQATQVGATSLDFG